VYGQFHAPAALSPAKEPSVLFEKEAGHALELIWALWRREQYLAPAENQIQFEDTCMLTLENSFAVLTNLQIGM
jgi:hypothetical protein